MLFTSWRAAPPHRAAVQPQPYVLCVLFVPFVMPGKIPDHDPLLSNRSVTVGFDSPLEEERVMNSTAPRLPRSSRTTKHTQVRSPPHTPIEATVDRGLPVLIAWPGTMEASSTSRGDDIGMWRTEAPAPRRQRTQHARPPPRAIPDKVGAATGRPLTRWSLAGGSAPHRTAAQRAPGEPPPRRHAHTCPQLVPAASWCQLQVPAPLFSEDNCE
jgi:hypothetical protein